MKKWIFLFALLIAGGAVAYLDHSGLLDVRSLLSSGAKQAQELAKDLVPEEAKAAAKTDHGSASDNSRLVPSVTVAVVSSQDFVDDIMVTGSLVAREQVLVAPEVEGLRIIGLSVEEGDSISKGGLLATLEQETLRAKKAQSEADLQRSIAAIAQAESGVAEAEATLRDAEAQLARAKPLLKNKYLSESTYDQRRASAGVARARLATAKDGVAVAKAAKTQIEAQLRELDWNLSRTEVRAPVAGLVTRRNARVGDLASGSKTALFYLAKDCEIELEATVIEPKLARMSPDQPANVQVSGAGKVDGKVRLISPEIDPTTRLGKVRIFLGKDENLRIGAFGRANVLANRHRGLAVPLSAVLYDAGDAYVQKIEDGKVKSTPVELGLSADDMIEIASGLSLGDHVVAKAGSFLRDGDAVRPAKDARRVSENRE